MRLAASAVALLALHAGSSLAQEPAKVPSFGAAVDLVTVDVVVLDKHGQPVRGLRREDFRLSEDGRPQELATFEPFEGGVEEISAIAPPEPALGPRGGRARPGLPAGARTFVLLVDDLGIAGFRSGDVRKAIARFFEQGLRDGDELIFATTSRRIWWPTRLPEAREDVPALLESISGRRLVERAGDAMTEWEAFRITTGEGTSEARLESMGASASPTDPPPASGAPGASSSPMGPTPPGSSITERVVARWLQRNLCLPEALGMCRTSVRTRAQQIDLARLNRTRDTLSAIDRAVFALTGSRGRKALLLFTEGFLNDPMVSAVQEVAGRCREANIAIYSMDVRGLESGFTEDTVGYGNANVAEMSLMRSEALYASVGGSEGLAADTGGLAIRDTNDLAGRAVEVADESRVYYLLGFSPPDGKGPRDWRKLKVTVDRPGVTVRARKGYTLRSSTEIAKASVAAPDKRPVDVTRALLAPQEHSDIPLRARAYAFGDRPGGKVSVVFAVEADLARMSNLGGDRPRGAVSLSIAATHRATGAVTRVDQQVTVDAGQGGGWEGWLALQRELELPPGVSQARVVVRDDFLGRVGATTIRFDVPAAGDVRLATPVLTDRLRSRGPGFAPVPVLMARRVFAPGGRLYCQFQVIGSKGADGSPASAESRFLVRRAGGDTVTEGNPGALSLGVDGRLTGLVGVPLEGLAAGPYELVLRVDTSGRVLESTEAFRVEAGS